MPSPHEDVQQPHKGQPQKSEHDAEQRAMAARKGSPFLRSKEAAFYLGLKPHTLIRMRMRKQGPAFRRHGRHIFYHIDDLDKWSRRL